MEHHDRDSFVAAVIHAYTTTPGTLGRARASDRKLAQQLFESRIPLNVVTAALALAATRRLCRPPDAEPLETVRSLYYFRPVIDELLREDFKPVLLAYFEDRLQRLLANQ